MVSARRTGISYGKDLYISSIISFFLFLLGGEGPANLKWVNNPNITYLTWARKYNAAVFFLEHRYYGQSRPKPYG
jgi:hypothetical protein